jgi:hypothetical protein
MRTFDMIRHNDESGISGTGKVLEGAIFSNGQVIVYWTSGQFHSFGFFTNFFEFYGIHIKPHPTNNTQIVFNNEASAEPVRREKRKICRHCKNEYRLHPRDQQWVENEFVRSCSGNLVQLES